jgi:sugar (pentulose or hexulose) kinase
VTSVGIDLGTTNTKVALVDADSGRVLAVASAPTPEPAYLAEVLRRLLRLVLDGAPAPGAVGIASMAETGVPLDASGAPLGGWLRWDGHRARAEADELARRLGWAELVAATGVRPSAKVPLATWAWLRARRPDTWSAMARWAGAADLAGYLLTGRLATDHTLAGRTMAYRLPAPGDAVPDGFDAALLAEVGLRPEQLPDVVPGGVSGRVADPMFGLRPGTPVVIAGHDHAVGAYAAGVREPGDVADSLGTAEAILTLAAAPDPVEVGRAGMSAVVTVGGARAILAGSSSAGALVQWWLAHESGGVAADELLASALDVDGPTDVLVLPYLAGRQTPHPDATAQLRVIGRAGQSPAYLARAMLEGLSLHARWIAQEQFRLAGLDEPSITVLGAPAATNTAWLQIKAQVMPWPLQAVTVAEPVAAGAALLAAERAGRAGLIADRAGLIAASPPLERRPVASTGPGYDRSFARFVAAAREEQA